MSLDGDITLLRRVPLFAELPLEQLRLIAFSAVRLDMLAGQVLFREGQEAHAGYVIANGALELSRGEGASRQVLATCEPGSLVGETALFIETKRPATATTTSASQLLEIDRKLIARMLREFPHIAARMRAVLAERLTATVAELGRVHDTLANVDKLMPRR